MLVMPMLGAVCAFCMIRTFLRFLLIAERRYRVEADWKVRDPTSGASVAHAGALRCDTPLVLRALEMGCSVNDSDWMGQTPLHYAAAACCFQTYEALQKRGADNAALDLYGQTPHDFYVACT